MILEERGVALQRLREPGLRFQNSWTHDRRGLSQLLARPKPKTVLTPIIPVRNPFDPMTIAANLRRKLRGQSLRVNNSGIGLSCAVKLVAPNWIMVDLDMLFRRAMTSFTRDT